MSCLEVDAAISNPADVTLEQVDQLAQLEPYGAGNPRPVFALLGATVDSVQAVGQGKHLKLRLSKGPCRFDAIFFSMTAEAAAQLEPGCRVDAAFYLAGQHLPGHHHPAIAAGGPAPLSDSQPPRGGILDLLHRLTGEQPLTAQETARLMASRDQFAAFWRILEPAPEAGQAGNRPAALSPFSGGAGRRLRQLSPGRAGPDGLSGAGTDLPVPAGGPGYAMSQSHSGKGGSLRLSLPAPASGAVRTVKRGDCAVTH